MISNQALGSESSCGASRWTKVFSFVLANHLIFDKFNHFDSFLMMLSYLDAPSELKCDIHKILYANSLVD